MRSIRTKMTVIFTLICIGSMAQTEESFDTIQKDVSYVGNFIDELNHSLSVLNDKKQLIVTDFEMINSKIQRILTKQP